MRRPAFSRTDVPELRKDLGSRLMHLRSDFAPGRECFPEKAWNIRTVDRSWAIDRNAFGNHKPDILCSTSCIVICDLTGWNATWRAAAGHWSHDDAVWKRETIAFKWAKQGFGYRHTSLHMRLN
ncbi:hypothetical protein CBM2623_B30091 [Cupriavidus taiwanensis]|nr:hypothetical protein CBM2608_B30090 [Cupriavidus taiwanensis]SPA34444.1 hypothetical protein CBM2623_B30091 [Cupriavidus taiwanensis]